MEQNEQPAYKFTAFISYKRGEDDEKHAKWLQGKLESFRIPTEIAPSASGDMANRRFRVFRDKTDLGSHAELREGLHKSLEQCRYLIVVCSPRSAASPYVDAEVRWFQENGRADAIIPFIISGTPAPREGEEQCYPPALNAESLGITLAEGSREEALIKIVARLLQVDFHSLYQRHLRAQRRFMIKVAAGLTLILALVAGLAVWAVNAERRATAQRKEAEGLVRFMTFDLRDEAFQYIPVKAREQITQKVEDYYERWGAESLEARYVRAIHESNRAVRLFEAGDLSGAEALLPGILATVTALRKKLPDDAELLRMEVLIRSARGALALVRGANATESLAETEYGLGLAREMARKQPDDPAALHTLAAMEENAGRTFFMAGNFDKGREHAEAAVAIRRDLTARHPQNAAFERDYLNALGTLCSTLAAAGKNSPTYDELIGAYRGKSEADPHNLDLRLRLAGALQHKTFSFFRQRKFDAALPSHRENLVIFLDLLARDPDNGIVRSQAALSRALEALLGLMQGRSPAETAALLTEAENDLARVAGKDRGSPFWLRAHEVVKQARALLETQQNQEKKSLAVLEGLKTAESALAAKPDNVRLALDFADKARTADTFFRDGPHGKTCLQYLEKVTESLRTLAKARPADAKLRAELLQTLTQLADARRADKNFAAAREVGEEALALLEAAGPELARDTNAVEAAAGVMDSLGSAFFDMDDLRAALDFFQKNLELCRELAKEGGALERMQLMDALEKTAGVTAGLGRMREAAAMNNEAVTLSRRAVAEPSLLLMGTERLMLADSLRWAAITATAHGRFDAAADALDEARQFLKNPPGAMLRESWLKVSLAVLARRAGVELLRGNPAAALPPLEEAAAFTGRSPEENSKTAAQFTPGDRWDLLLADALLMAGRTGEARAALERVRAGMFPSDLEKSQEDLLGNAEAARLDALLLLSENNKNAAAVACERVLPILEQRANKPEAGIFYSRPYLRLLSAHAAGLEAAGRPAEALKIHEKAADHGRHAVSMAPGHALLAKELQEALLAAARLKKTAGNKAGAAILEKEAGDLKTTAVTPEWESKGPPAGPK